MKEVYPVFIEKGSKFFLVNIPDFDAKTQGLDLVNSIDMARDLIGLLGIQLEDEGKEIPKPNTFNFETPENAIFTLIDIDFKEYRKKLNNKLVRKNLTIPSWLNFEAEKAGLNFSQILQKALKKELNIKEF